MYTEILAEALKGWSHDLTNDELLEYVVARRTALPARDLGAGTWSVVTLATEVTYDCALINLAAAQGIDVSPKHFTHPKIARELLEQELFERGIDLDLPAQRLRREEEEKT